MKTLIFTLLLIPTLSFASIDSNLRLGAKGSEVVKLQTLLVEKGYQTQITGYFGAKTLLAVKKYQKANKLPSTGFVGPQTRLQMNFIPVPIPLKVESKAEATVAPVVVERTILPTRIEIVQPVEKVYTKPMEETPIIQPVITLGTPTYEYSKLAQGYEAYIPVTIDVTTVKNGGTLIVTGTVPEEGKEGASYRVGTEFNKTTPKPYAIEVHQVRGLYTYTITLKDNQGDVIYTRNGTMTIPKHESEL